MRVRRAELADVDALVSLVNSAYRGESAKVGWTTEADLLDGQRVDREGIEKLIAFDDSSILVAEEEGVLVGCVEVKNGDKGSYIGMLTVNPTLQNRGLGRQLLSYAEEYAREKGSIRAFMTVIGVRSELIAWYERRGYRRTGERRDFPTHDPRFGLPKVAGNLLQFEVLEKHLD